MLPARVHGQYQTTGNGGSYAWASTDPGEAVGYARRTASDTGKTGHVYRVRPIDGDTAGPEDAKGKFAQGRESGWLVEGHAWSTDQTDTQRRTQVYRANDRMDRLRKRRETRVNAYTRDSRLNPAESAAKEAALSEVSPEHKQRSAQFNETLKQLAELLTPTW